MTARLIPREHPSPLSRRGKAAPIPETRDANWLLALLTNGTPHREVYVTGDGTGRWFVTYGGGEVPASVVRELVERGAIHSVYSDCPDRAYHVGKTLDVQATAPERKKHRRGKDAPRIYTDGSRA